MHKVKVFIGQTVEKTEAEVNHWLKANKPVDVQIIPSMSVTSVAVPVASPSLIGGKLISSGQPTGVQIQVVSVFSITIVYQEKGGKVQ